MAAVLGAVRSQGFQVLCLMPNADAGNSAIRGAIEMAVSYDEGIRVVTHLPREEYVSWLASADVLVGNSSSGIIEAASFGVPVVNIGGRQAGRERNSNTFDCIAEIGAIKTALVHALKYPRSDRRNIYGDGRTDILVADLIEHTPFDTAILRKRLVY